MNSFHTTAIPHKDILEGRLTMDIFAADLWDVSQKRGSEEYRDASIFFDKTYVTQGLDNLLGIVEKRLKGKGGDPMIQLQTPFGGGKTHALIAMYHRAPSWRAKVVTAVGTSLSTEQTLWGLIEEQLTGQNRKLGGRVAPGKEALRTLLVDNQPVLILMDEILEYVTRAAGVRVEQSTLAAQTIAFMHELSELVATLERVVLVVTLPSSVTEHYDEAAENLYQKLQKVTGRVERIYTPVQDSEITHIVRQRLFNRIDEAQSTKTVNLFVDYAEREGILPDNTSTQEYRQRFRESYPFLPEVIDALYHRWGSFPGFQRTRGVLRILSLVIFYACKTSKPYISLADFDLSNQELRQELLKNIGQEFNSVIDMDITGPTANAAKIDDTLGDSYRGLNLSTRTAHSIFLYSFSGGQEQGIDLKAVKRNATTTQNPAAVISEVIDELEKKLFYIQCSSGRYYFSSQANLNRILITQKSNVGEELLEEQEWELLKKSIGDSPFKVILWSQDSTQIPDTEELKFLVFKSENRSLMEEIYNKKGQNPRVYRNTLFFLYPLENEKVVLKDTIRQQIAYRRIENDNKLRLTKEQEETVKSRLKKIGANLNELIRRSYRLIEYPGRGDFEKLDLGVPTYGDPISLDQDVYNRLREENEILETIAPIVIKEKYLSGRDYVLTDLMYYSSLKTPGETRFVQRSTIEKSIKEGVKVGMFGLGELENNLPRCRYFKEECSLAFSGSEVIIRDVICQEQKSQDDQTAGEKQASTVAQPSPEEKPEHHHTTRPVESPGGVGTKEKLHLKFRLAKGKVHDLMGVMNYLQFKFTGIDIELTAEGGSITLQEYEDKIQEAFSQMGIPIEE